MPRWPSADTTGATKVLATAAAISFLFMRDTSNMYCNQKKFFLLSPSKKLAKLLTAQRNVPT